MKEEKFKYPKGSTWRKWDLQACTRAYCNYEGPTLNSEQLNRLQALTGIEKAKIQSKHESLTDEEYAKLYIEYLIEYTDLDVIGIADHNTGRGIQAILNYLTEKRKSDPSRYSRLNILPGVEFGADDKCHIIAIFDDSPSNKNRYEYDGNGKPIRLLTWDEYIERFLNEIHIPPNRFDKGKPTNSRDLSTKRILDLTEDWYFLPVFPHVGDDNGWAKLAESNRKLTYEHEMFGIVDIKNATGNTDLMLILDGKKAEYGVTAIAKINTSDAKSITEIGKNFTWIKSDPTAEGLKQIIYEPLERVLIQPAKPEEKKSYFVIDKVRFIDQSHPPKFSGEYIELNPNLTAIIGGKSTGKSLLLHYIAKAIDAEEVSKRIENTKNKISYSLDQEAGFDFEVVWQDQETVKLKLPAEEQKEDKRKILYIPQQYLNTLTEVNIKSREALNEFVLASLMQDETLKNQYVEVMQNVRQLHKKIPALVEQLFIVHDEIKAIEEEVKQAGDRKGIEKYIKKLQQEIEKIKTESGLSDPELLQYEKLTEEQEKIASEASNLRGDQNTISKMVSELTSIAEQLGIAVRDHKSYLNTQAIITAVEKQFGFLNELQAKINTAASPIDQSVSSKLDELDKKTKAIQTNLSPLIAKAKLQDELEQKNLTLSEEQEKLNDIGIKRKALALKDKSFTSLKNEILSTYKKSVQHYSDISAEFKKYEKQFDDITVNTSVGYRADIFNEEVVDGFLRKQDLKRIDGTSWRDEFYYDYAEQTHCSVIEKIFEGLLSNQVKTVKGRSCKDAIIKLLENRFTVDFSIFYKNDSLDKMSPGKKGIVLLRILIELSNEAWPILLDQPEDDLDSRSIYNELVGFLKKKKKTRQIILVTHNPNLVVGADAEEIVVANQEGQEQGRENKKYKFEYVTGSLENIFEDESESAILYC